MLQQMQMRKSAPSVGCTIYFLQQCSHDNYTIGEINNNHMVHATTITTTARTPSIAVFIIQRHYSII